MPRILLNHPTGNANSRAALNGLFDFSLLAAFHTSVAMFSGNVWYMLARLPSGRELKRREYADRFKPITWQRPYREIGRILAAKVRLTSLTRHETGIFCVDAVYRDLDRTVAKRLVQMAVDGVYAYEDGSLETFRVAKNRGIKCFYDLPIGYWRTARRLLEPERDRWPEWLGTLSGFKDSPEKLARKDEELHLADHVFVASSFTKQTLWDYPGEIASVTVTPYGFPEVGPPRDYSNAGKRKLKLLFVGGLSQRKGIADVFAIAETLKDDVELTIVGQGAVNECVALSNALKRHHWIPSLPHSDVLRVMREHDVLLFPSLFEGFGLVITEAMSQGTPVITTDRTAGPDVITDGRDGWIIPAGDTNALQRQVEALLHQPDHIAAAGEAARQTAANRPWANYGSELARRISAMLAS